MMSKGRPSALQIQIGSLAKRLIGKRVNTCGDPQRRALVAATEFYDYLIKAAKKSSSSNLCQVGPD